jgi:hypothetical protein
MRHFLLASKKFYRNNGLLGLSFSKINQLRAGADYNGKIPHVKLSEQIDEIINNDQISNAQKVPFRKLREDSIFDDHEKVIRERLCKSLIAKANHPLYSRIKSKVPYFLMAPFTFTELHRLAAYRIAGLATAPITLPALIGFSLPCALTFSMLEMYAPDNKFKFGCKFAKWTGGIGFYTLCYGVDSLSAGFETLVFGEQLPMDAPQLMGTLPTINDIKEAEKFKKLVESVIYKSPLP